MVQEAFVGFRVLLGIQRCRDVCIYIYIHAVYAHTYVCMYLYIYMSTYLYMYMYMHLWLRVQFSVHEIRGPLMKLLMFQAPVCSMGFPIFLGPFWGLCIVGRSHISIHCHLQSLLRPYSAALAAAAVVVVPRSSIGIVQVIQLISVMMIFDCWQGASYQHSQCSNYRYHPVVDSL